MAIKKPVRLSRKDRLRILELAATGYYDSPTQTIARARTYEAFVYGEAKSQQKGRKPPISPRKPLIIRRKKR